MTDNIYVLRGYGSYEVHICLNYMDGSHDMSSCVLHKGSHLITVNYVKMYTLKYMCGTLQCTLFAYMHISSVVYYMFLIMIIFMHILFLE